ncbi:hypothetical protein ACH49_13550 [Streptomyces leeuwenhoekii]|uniref:Uncharacterized protein n=1 Tax=Streptomyces leeuwenhoekii TaxID=1437453 RepID=A0ABR5HYY4_STRLW|nr:hypothetical protein [Streptomyces leeuwenhoekii]KMS79078.1 hypothetical protein ACH49_13550 [Streptomyces leeuwenhoekii]
MAGRRRGGADSRCPACGAPLLVQWVGHTAALQARVDLPPPDEPRPYGPAAAASTPNDLVWCLPRRPFGALRLRWTTGRHPPDCPHQHLLTHRCTTEPTTLF